jgi:hypothetical protein
MATTYKVQVDHDQTLTSPADDLAPQPRCEGLQYTREVPLGGDIFVEGAYFVLIWDILDEISAYTTILNKCGLLSARTANVTVYGPTENYGWTTYNAEAVRPLVGAQVTRNRFFIRNVQILFRNLSLP